MQLRLAREKEDCGIRGFLTQPVLSREALDNLKRAREVLKGRLLGGIFPVVSYRNACFLNNEVAGIRGVRGRSSGSTGTRAGRRARRSP